MKALFRGFVAIVYKEFIVVLRDRTTLFFMFFPPLLQIIAFGFALDNDPKHLRLLLYDEDRTRESRALVEAFVNTMSFRLVGEVHSAAELASALRAGQATAGLQIPPDFSRRLRAGRNAQVQVLIDGSNSTPALQALNTAMGVAFRRSLGTLLAQSGRRDLPVEVRPQILYNPAMKSPNFFVPGVIGIALQIATMISTALSVVRERERGTLEQLLVSPMGKGALMLGKLTPYLFIAMVMAGVLVAVLHFVFFIPIAGSLWALAVGSLAYIFALLCLGLLISTVAQNHMQALQISMAFMLPTIFFSGFIFPRETLPWIFYAISTVLPATYYIELVRGVVLRGALFSEYVNALVALVLIGLTLFAVCTMRFRRTIG